MTDGASTRDAEVLVIGGGPGGYVAAIRAGHLDLDVTLVEKDAYGGACLNRGCIPSKALLSGTGLARDAGTAAEMGIDADPDVDLDAMTDWTDDVVDRLTSGVEKLCRANGVDLVEGRAEFVDEHVARVVDGGEDVAEIEFEHAIVATGSRPIEVPGFDFGADPVLDSAQALDLSEPPDSLVVIGAGYVGMELSTVFARLGTDVTVIEMLESVLPAYPDDLTRPVRTRAEDLGVDVRFGESASGWYESAEGTAPGEGIVVETEAEDGETRGYPAERVLVAVGRDPVTDTVNLDAVGLEPDDDGFLPTDGQARTEADHVFAVGDVAGEPMLAHAASAEGEVAAEAIAGEATGLEDRAIPAAVFTDPEIGVVGLTEAEAEAEGYDPVVGEFPLRANGRALTRGESEGFVRLVVDDGTGTVLGGQVLAPEASESIAEIAVAIETGATVEEVAGTIHIHPTLSESVGEAAKNALGRAIHTLNR